MILLLTQRYLATGEAVAQEHGNGLLLLDGEVVEVVGELHQLPLLPVQLEEGPEVLAQCSRGQQPQHLQQQHVHNFTSTKKPKKWILSFIFFCRYDPTNRR